jgi:hypothetical protein
MGYRSTSRGAYASREPTRKELVYDAIKNIQPCTDKTLASYLGWKINQVTGRRNDLLNEGLVKKAGIVIQENREVIAWEIGRDKDYQPPVNYKERFSMAKIYLKKCLDEDINDDLRDRITIFLQS